MIRCYFRTRHEYRIALGLASLGGLLTGILDEGLGEDWTTKSFMWAGIGLLFLLIVSYELIHMPRPRRAFLLSMLFTTAFPSGWLSVHHFAWGILAVMKRGLVFWERSYPLWLAPYIIVDGYIYTVLTIVLFTYYIAILLYANLCPKKYYKGYKEERNKTP